MTVNPMCVRLSFSSRRKRSLNEEEVGKGSSSVKAEIGRSDISQREIGPAETVHTKRVNSKKS
jgi:hypothetical protein